jgi:endonuclease/exonuclease/phosphatase (EEP) superfamily protein YafD
MMACSSWFYAGIMLALWLLIRTQADHWWPATLVIFGPRWVWATPLAVFVPAAIVFRRRALIPLAVSLILLVGPVMGACFPWESWLDATSGRTRVRILTCNVDNVNLNVHALRGVLDDAKPDLVALQEWEDQHEAVLFDPGEWHVRSGRGLCLGSRYPIQKVTAHPDEHNWRDICMGHELEIPVGSVHFFNIHLSTPREGLEAVLARRWHGVTDLEANTAMRMRESAGVSGWIGHSEGRIVIAGDFNTPADSVIFRQSWGRYTDAFAAAGFGLGYTKFTRWYGIRIDHVLLGAGWTCRRSWVGPDVGSDHRPLLADLEWDDSKR